MAVAHVGGCPYAVAMSDDGAAERAHAIFDPIAADYLRREGVDIGPMFGSEGLRIRGKVFAFVGYRDSLGVKVPAARADAIVSSGDGERLAVRERVMREWVLIGPERSDSWEPLMAEAYAYVDELTP